tara:strand:- start:175 stop:1392 length:1218 start_codon:yes stop_codon:yes gene_type:complete
MDPYLSQGFSSLTKALIGDPETDYQVARTNRVNELLPLEKQQMQAQIGNSDAGASAARALATLRKAQTLTEDERRDPLVQLDIANAKAALALAGERDANATYRDAQTDTEVALLTPRVDKTNAEGDAATALETSRLAEAMFTDAQTDTEVALLTPRVDKTNAEGAAATALETSRLADSMFTDAQTDTENDTRGPTVDKINAEGDAATALAGERDAAADLNRAKTDAEGRIILNAGQTIRTTDANGKVSTYTAPENVEVTLDPGQEAVIINADGTQTRVTGPEGTGDPTDGIAKLDALDQQLVKFFESDDYSGVDQSLIRRIRSNITKASKGKDVEEASINAQSLLSQTYNGSSVFIVRTGTNFTVPAFVALAAQDSRMTVEKIVQLYGLSKNQATRLLKDVRAQE